MKTADLSVGVPVILLLLMMSRPSQSQLTFQPKNHWTTQALTSSRDLASASPRNPADMTLDQFVDKTIGMLALISLGIKNPDVVRLTGPRIPAADAGAAAAAVLGASDLFAKSPRERRLTRSEVASCCLLRPDARV